MSPDPSPGSFVSRGGGLTGLSIVAASEQLTEREVTAAALTEAYLSRIAATDDALNAYVTVTAESAIREAERADERRRSGAEVGPLCGVPLGLKDLYDVRGVVTTAGSRLLAGNVAHGDSSVTSRLRGAGAVLLGKQSTHEFAWGGTTNNPHFGATHNPHDRSRIPGGSSGGSAASVVAGSCAGAFGTDTCGSVRIPAALSGCVGLKPTYGRISLHRVVPLAYSLDHSGPLARTVRDVALLYTAVAGFDARDARTLPVPVSDPLSGLEADIRDLRVGRLRGWYESVLDPDVRACVDTAAGMLADAGAIITDVVPSGQDPPIQDMFAILAGDAVPWHWARFGQRPDGYSLGLSRLIGAGPPDPDTLVKARERVGVQVTTLLEFLAEVDLLLCATVPAPAPKIGESEVVVDQAKVDLEWMLTRLTSVFDAARLPALSVPVAPSREGLPVGVQVIGRHLDETTVLRAGRQLEKRAESQLRI